MRSVWFILPYVPYYVNTILRTVPHTSHTTQNVYSDGSVAIIGTILSAKVSSSSTHVKSLG